jgi:hypothetical protein
LAAASERAKERMRLYGRAHVLLGQRYPDERKRLFREARLAGLRKPYIESQAYRKLRENHREEFQEIYGKLRTAPCPEGQLRMV